MAKVMTLCMVHEGSRLLLGMKKRGFGEGRWNGFGGKVQEKETIEAAAKRELMEEAGIRPKDIRKRGKLLFSFEGESEPLEVHVFSVLGFQGDPVETDEMRPRWFTTEEIPYQSMWPDDKHWLPLLLSGKDFDGKFFFKDSNTLISHQIKEV